MGNTPSVSQTITGVVVAGALFLLFRYRMSIKRRLTKMKETPKHPLTMTRVGPQETGGPASPSSPLGQQLQLLELNEAWRAKHCAGWSIISLGEYLSQLRPVYLPSSVNHEDLPAGIQSQIETALSQTLLKVLGPHLGAAVLPAVGALNKPLQGASEGLAEAGKKGAVAIKKSKGSAPIALFAVGAATDAAARATVGTPHPDPDELTPLALMHIGEVGYDPSFGSTLPWTPVDKSTPLLQPTTTTGDNVPLIPNPFIVSKHWNQAIDGMESLLQQASGGEYDPNSKKLSDPVPVNEAMLPDLHLGWGKAECSHTQREIVRNRLLASLLNRLGANYADDDVPPFVLHMQQGGKAITAPADFVEELMRTGHTLVACPKSAITTFGIAMCVKEQDGSWSNIPLAFFVQSGYEDFDGESAVVYMPHSGLSMEISGPLVGEGNKCNIQHYLAIEGMCGWHSDHDPITPWRKAVDCCEPFCGDDCVEAVRLAALEAVTMNTVGTKMSLPHGGYGLTGVCNDTAAIIECAMNGKTNLYPMTTIGRFGADSIRCTKQIHDRLATDPSMKKEITSLRRLMQAMLSLPNDYHALPPGSIDASRRMLHTLPEEPPFELMVQAKQVMEKLYREHEEYLFIHSKSVTPARRK